MEIAPSGEMRNRVRGTGGRVINGRWRRIEMALYRDAVDACHVWV